MLNLLNWNKSLKVNGQVFQNSAEALKTFADYEGKIEIHLNFEEEVKTDNQVSKAEQSENFKIAI